MKTIGIVPARGGSKGIPRKNLQLIGDKSLLGRAISSGQSAQTIDEVVVSSENSEILKQATSLGARILRRPTEIASDASLARDVVAHAIQALELKDRDVMVYLQPTSPFRTAEHVDAAMQLRIPVVSVVKTAQPPEKRVTIDEHDRIEVDFPEADLQAMNRQLLPVSWHPNGAIYAFRVEDFNRRLNFPISGATAFEMTSIQSIDIDTEEDLVVARAIASTFGI